MTESDQDNDRVFEAAQSGIVEAKHQTIDRTRPDAATLLAFAALVFLVAANVVAVKFSNRELAPFLGASARFGSASILFLVYSIVQRLPLPRGRALTGVILFGILQFGLGFALAYWSLQQMPASMGSVILASIPLFTVLFAFMARIEPFRMRGLLGSLVTVGGIAVMFGERAGVDVPAPYLMAGLATAMVFAFSAVVVKSFPHVHLAVMNGIGMLIGALLLLVLSFLNQEPFVKPSDPATWAAFLYLVLPGSVGLFGLLLFILKRWTATAVSYQTVLSPIVAIALSYWLLGEPLTGGLYLGSILVIAGVYIGVLAPSRRSSRDL